MEPYLGNMEHMRNPNDTRSLLKKCNKMSTKKMALSLGYTKYGNENITYKGVYFVLLVQRRRLSDFVFWQD